MEKLKAFINRHTSVEVDKITMVTSLDKDLGFYGDEAYDFLCDFSKEFKVDISQFEFDKYFKPETDLITAFLTKKIMKKKEREPINVQKLAEAIQSGILK